MPIISGIHDKIIQKVNPKALSADIVGAPAIRNVFTSLKERLIDEEFMPGAMSRAIASTLDRECDVLVHNLDAAFRATLEEKRHQQQKRASWQAHATRLRWVKPYQSLRAKILQESPRGSARCERHHGRPLRVCPRAEPASTRRPPRAGRT